MGEILFKDIVEGEGEFFPVLSFEDENKIINEDVPEILDILPLRNTVLFPGTIIPITVGRDKSIKLVKEIYKGNRTLGVVAQKDPSVENPVGADLQKIGTVGYIIKLLQMPDGTNTVIIQGRNRFRISGVISEEPWFVATVNKFGKALNKIKSDPEFEATLSSIKDLSLRIVKESPNIPSEASFAIQNIESPYFLLYFVCSNLGISIEEKQKLLEIDNFKELGQKILALLSTEIQLLELKEQIQKKVKTDIDKQQRDYFLNMQLKTIQDELGGQPHEQELNEIKEKAAQKLWSKEIQETFDKELSKLQRMNPAAAEFSIQMNYLELFVELPWNEFSTDNFDLDHARKVLDDDHFGLEKVKERILEFLAVTKLNDRLKSPILCLVGPPGVGKTSLGKSIARSLERKYIRMSLGGLRDESELRGHRKTYIGAMPGRIIQNLRKAKTSNPVFVLDEIDKVSGNNFQGDPQAALLEVLDPEQNNTFYDNYLEVEYDLSRIMFIATANTLSTIHPALRDRMEIIELSGYTLEEKMEIAKRHLIRKQMEENGMSKSGLKFSEASLKAIIADYTRESGVRLLEKNIAKVIRHFAVKFAQGEKIAKTLKAPDIKEILGVPVNYRDKVLRKPVAGVVVGMAWTAAGGEILFVEASASKGKGLMSITGNLGDVMKESATLAFEFLKAHCGDFGLEENVFETRNIHIHVPEGATPKDGPSAGVTLLTALYSILSGKAPKNDLAMTGEITLRGKVLPVGGIKEKILAARRAGISEIILPEDNRADFNEIESRYVSGLEVHFVSEMAEVIRIAMGK